MISTFEEHLLRESVISPEALEQGRGEAARVSRPLVDTLRDMGLIEPEALYRALAAYCELEYLPLKKETIDPAVRELAPARFVTHFRFMPVREEGDALVVAIGDPLDPHLLDDIRMLLKRPIVAVVSTPQDIEKKTKEIYGLGADTVERIVSEAEESGHAVALEVAGSDLSDAGVDASIVKFVNELLTEAIDAAATDVHIEPFQDELRVRYRIDGVLHAVPTPASVRGFQTSIVSRIKVMANLNIAEKRLPQDGKIQASIGDRQFDLRVSVLPTPHGETINIRILSRSSLYMSLEDLGFRDNDLAQINEFIRRPHGIILLTGPTGSGKTTTLYAALGRLNHLDRKTITIEDPIEYQLKGITQMQVLPQIGFSFATGLRSMLRHDPDIMMVGEIRDYETAEMAVRASLTGHLVFSTLHTNDAAGTVTRLVDMGVEPFLIASTMIASIAQRLVRRVCEDCAEVIEPSREAFAELRVNPVDHPDAVFRQGRGCEQCRNTGYRGRIAIAEILPFNETIREMTVNGATSGDIKKKGRALGMLTLRDAGWNRVKSGHTTIEEVLRVTADTDFMDD